MARSEPTKGAAPQPAPSRAPSAAPVAPAGARPPVGTSADQVRAAASGKSPSGSNRPTVGSKPGLGKLASKPGTKAKSAARSTAAPRERMTLDGPWEWAFDRMLDRKRAAEAQARQEARQKAKPSAAARRPAGGSSEAAPRK